MEMRKYPNRDSVSTIGKTVPEHLIHQPFYKSYSLFFSRANVSNWSIIRKKNLRFSCLGTVYIFVPFRPIKGRKAIVGKNCICGYRDHCETKDDRCVSQKIQAEGSIGV